MRAKIALEIKRKAYLSIIKSSDFIHQRKFFKKFMDLVISFDGKSTMKPMKLKFQGPES